MRKIRGVTSDSLCKGAEGKTFIVTGPTRCGSTAVRTCDIPRAFSASDTQRGNTTRDRREIRLAPHYAAGLALRWPRHWREVALQVSFSGRPGQPPADAARSPMRWFEL